MFTRIKSTLKHLCSPAFFYFILSCVVLVGTIIQNAGNTRKYCIGNFECNVGNNAVVFLLKVLYIVFWTFVLDYICKSGYTNISWFLVLLPFVSLFILLIGMIFFINKTEGEGRKPIKH
jgi:hypothetical protein